jgi:glycosyltransferase involved in cell wall biosynthesis
MMEHTFAICAYKDSEYLEKCIKSLKKQTVESKIIMVTHTPSEYQDSLAKKYDIPVYVNTGETGITQDWNFALSRVDTRFATIAHQDDIYEPSYAEKMLFQLKHSKRPIIAFSDYAEIRNGRKTIDVKMLKIKRLMLVPLKIKAFRGSRFVRRRILSMGDPICCPSVCFDLDYVKQPIFADHFKSCEDWEAWEKLSKMKGDFIYIPKPLMCHRIHEESATTAIINDNKRGGENLEMFAKFWPLPIAKLINRFYNKSEDSNDLHNA